MLLRSKIEFFLSTYDTLLKKYGFGCIMQVLYEYKKDGRMEKVKTFQVKEVCNICKVTRKALLVYEGKACLRPII